MQISYKTFWILFFAGMHFSIQAPGQQDQDNSLEQCELLMSDGYISDGQDYKAKLNKNNRARFHTIFYGENRYCLVACCNIEEYPLIMKVYDSERNVLFDNTRHGYSPKWHLEFTSTLSCIVEIQVDAKEPVNELVELMIGFKNSEP